MNLDLLSRLLIAGTYRSLPVRRLGTYLQSSGVLVRSRVEQLRAEPPRAESRAASAWADLLARKLGSAAERRRQLDPAPEAVGWPGLLPLLYPSRPWARSSTVEQLTLNQLVLGSNPSGLTNLDVKRPLPITGEGSSPSR
jgi:hypothetical protein